MAYAKITKTSVKLPKTMQYFLCFFMQAVAHKTQTFSNINKKLYKYYNSYFLRVA